MYFITITEAVVRVVIFRFFSALNLLKLKFMSTEFWKWKYEY